jgi:glycosyltransferase involved in cell wall biosynthesis
MNMRILHIIPSLNTGGAERLALDMCRELQRQRHEVKLVIFHDKNDYKYLSADVDVRLLPVYVHPSVFGKWQVNTGALNNLINEFRPDIIHSHLFEAEVLSRHKIHSGIKYFTHLHDNMPQFRNFSFQTLAEKRRLTDFYEKQYLLKKYAECDNKFIAISNDTKEYFQKTLPAPLSPNIFLLNNAVDFNRFNAVNHERTLESIRLVNAGSFVPKKNQQFLVDVVKELVKVRNDVKLVLLGDGPLLNDVKKKIKEYGLENHIECKGNVESVESYLAEANVYVHSATYEPFGLVLLEAMAAGLPVIALDGKGNRDIMKDYVGGLMIKEQDAKVFAEKILRLYREPQSYRKVSEESVGVAKRFGMGEYGRKLVEIYEGLKG